MTIGPARHVFLSPHHDDVCFSLGVTAGRISGLLLNVFSLSAYIAVEPMPALDEQPKVSRIRDDEDREFAEAGRLNRLNLGQLDCPLRGFEAFDTAELEAEVESFRPTVTEALLANPHSPADRPILFCPAGIGRHRDHLLLRDCVIADYGKLLERYRIVFYEDLHYASSASVRESGLRDLRQATRELGYSVRYRFDIPTTKLDLIRLYASQFYEPPTDLARFTPADGSGELHEAVWANAQIAELDLLGTPSVEP